MLHKRPRFGIGAGVLVACLCVANSVAAQLDFPARARAALHILPDRVQKQETTDRAFGLSYLLDVFSAPRTVGRDAEIFTLYTIETARGFVPMGVTSGREHLARDFERMRGERAGSAGGHALYTYRNGARGRLALVGRREIAEGSDEALRIGLQEPAHDASAPARHDLERSLRELADTGAAATLVYVAPASGSNLVQIVRDLGPIWGPQLAESIEPYEAVLGLLGSMRGGRADVWQEGADLGVRIVLVASDAAAAKRSHLALRTARGLAGMASKAAVRSGSMSQQDAEVLTAVLRDMDSHVDDDRIVVRLVVPGSVVQ